MGTKDYIIGCLAVLFISIGIGREYMKDTILSQTQMALQISEYIEETQSEISNTLDDHSFLERLLFDSVYYNSSNKITFEDQKKIESLNSKPYTIFIFNKDSLNYWSNNKVSLPDNISLEKLNIGIDTLLNMNNGVYFMERTQKSINNETFDILSFIWIKVEYKITSKYLLDKYLVEDIPNGIEISKQKSTTPIKVNGETEFYIQGEKTVENLQFQSIQLGLYLIGFLLLFIFIDRFSCYVSYKYHPAMGSGLFVSILFGLKLYGNYINFTSRFDLLIVFQETFKNFFLSRSLGDFFINIFLLLWVIVFIYRQYKSTEQDFSRLTEPVRFLLTILNSTGIILVVIFIAFIFKGLILDSQVSFYLDFVFDGFSLPSIVGIILLMFGLFVFSQLMMESILKINLSKTKRVIAYLVTVIMIIPIIYFLNLGLPIFDLSLFALVYLYLFDFYIDRKVFNLAWLVSWMAIFSIFAAVLLFKFNVDKDKKNRENYAKILSSYKDDVAESTLLELKKTLDTDTTLVNLISTSEHSKAKINDHLMNLFLKDGYLFNNYQFDFFIFDHLFQPFFEGDISSEKFQEQYNCITSNEFGGIRYCSQAGGEWTYIVSVPLKNNDENVYLFLEINTFKRGPSRVYTELLITRPFRNLPELDIYDYATYRKGRRIESSDKDLFPDMLEEYDADIPDYGVAKHGFRSNDHFTIYASENKEFVTIITRPIGGLVVPISLFSYIFAVLFVLSLMVASLNYFFKFLPELFEFNIFPKNSLKNRISLSVVVLIIVSFVFIGYVTVRYFSKNNQVYHENRAKRKTTSVLKDIKHELALNLQINKGYSISDIDISKISKIHRMDINIFDLEGKLVNSAGEELYKKGIISDRMDAAAFKALKRLDVQESTRNHENIGELFFKSSYVPLTIEGQQEVIGYLGIPYYSTVSKVTNDSHKFIGTLINVYVFILLIAGGLAFYVANSITKPLSEVGDRLKSFKLDGSHEPIEWHSNDEIGALISKFNEMVVQIEHSTSLLKKSEKELAWREMAQQVAHEIKNPLMPMKISIQYLEKVYAQSPETIGSTLARVCDTLIKQIDILASIASEFSLFAKMPRADNQAIEIISLTESVCNLFLQESGNSQLLFNAPKDKRIMVFADGKHLSRVFTNLVKNSIQAIPDEREGLIKVDIYTDDKFVFVKVEDNGTGISEEMIDKVFQPHFTTKSSGTGIGLAISKNIIESTNGKIYFETEVGVGTVFHVRMPIVNIENLKNWKTDTPK